MNIEITRKLSIILIIYFIVFHDLAYAGQISVSISENITANADFRQGETNKPAVFLLHGFMSTHNLNIIQIMADELENNGFTVLAPTLSLNINNRRAGANCDAVHTHTMESDIREIVWWMQWLQNKGYNKVIITGFSTGSLQIAILLTRNSLKFIKKAVLVSPAYLAGKPFSEDEEKADIATAKSMLRKNQNQLHEFHLSYCKGDFVAPPKVFLSYKKWTANRLMDVIKAISIPHSVIIGGDDHRFGNRLSKTLNNNQTTVITIPGANHFFDSPHEFDFLDAFLNEMVF